MLKKYICGYCNGEGLVTSYTVDSEGECTENRGQCPSCTAQGAPPWIEMAVNGPPAAKEHVIEVVAVIPEKKDDQGILVAP